MAYYRCSEGNDETDDVIELNPVRLGNKGPINQHT